VNESRAAILMVGDPPPEVLALQEVLADDGFQMLMLDQPQDAKRLLEEGSRARLLLLDWSQSEDDQRKLLDWVRHQPDLDHLGIVVLSEQAPEEVPANIGSRTFLSLLPDTGGHQLQSLTRAILANVDLQRSLKRKISEVNDCFRLLSLGTFNIRTQDDAELLSAHLGSAAGDPQLGICVLELLLNSIEHGNLEITYEDKSRMLEEGTFSEEIAGRLSSEEYREKSVVVQLSQQGEQIELLIEDSGSGFDYQKYLDLDPARILDRHGRGILMANALLDLDFIHPGNRVRVLLPMAEDES
jgi:CheY-like chemotaxis protein